ncbi:hypothetical protein FRC16_000079 [Serendipita sp. 398]|nr:hypothetical protein FRC16_000079 [Serendipita sp. 398]
MSGDHTWLAIGTFSCLKEPGEAQAASSYAYVRSGYSVEAGMIAHAFIPLSMIYSVCIRDASEAFSVKPRFPDQFVYLTLDVKDTEDQNLISLFPGARNFIYSAINAGGQVLVHCNGGISLSPAFVVMFVMEHFQLSCEDALHLVQNRRYCISPNGGFLVQIKEYEAIYRASLAVASAPAGQSRANRRKRDDEDEEEEE